MSPVNECVPKYEPGSRITGHCEAAVTGKRFVDISDPRQSGPGLSDTAEGGNIVVSPATADGKALGVASHDAAIGAKVTVILGGVVPVTADGPITAGADVEVGATGKAKTFTDGRAVGRAVGSASDGNDCLVLLFNGVSLPAPA